MAFAQLFKGLSAVEEDVKSPGQPAFPHSRNEPETGKRDKARKRKAQFQHTGPFQKKQLHDTDGEHASAGFTKDVMRNPSEKHGYKGQNYRTKSNCNVNKQQQKKKPDGQKNQHQQKDRWRPASRGGGHQTRPTWGNNGRYNQIRNDKEDVQVTRERFMSQEFKDQNALLVDGRLLCRHFLRGKCIKDDDCQLEHVKGCNDLIKELCKFYVQGICTKEESCPYMHNSFPCKFFHKKGNCKEENCRFSHEPLNEFTSQLLNEAVKRDQDLYELRKKAEMEASGQPENTEESEIIKADMTPDTTLQPLRPNFYNSTENTEKETSLCQTDKVEVEEKAAPPHASDASQPHEEPVCYSVAAVLGPQLFKPFPSFFTAQGSATLCSTSQSEVPYSVDAVLRSSKSVEYPIFSSSPTPSTEQTVSYTPKVDSDSLLSSENHSEKVHLASSKHEVNKSREKVFNSLSSLQVHTGLISQTYPGLTLASRDYKKQGYDGMPESLQPAQRAAHEEKLELQPPPEGTTQRGMHLPADITRSVNSKSVVPLRRTNRKSISSSPANWTSTFKHPTQLASHLSILTPDSQSGKPFCSSSGLSVFKEGSAAPVEPDSSSVAASDSAKSVSCHFSAKQPAEIHLHTKKTLSSLEGETSSEISAECSSKTSHGGGSTAGCKKTPKIPFNSLFASPVTDTLQPTGNSVTSSSCPQGFRQSSSPVKSAVETEKAPAKSILSLFAAPLSAPTLPCMQSQPDYSRISPPSKNSNQSVNNTSQLLNSKQRASNLETPLLGQVRTNVKEISHVPRSPNSSPKKAENEDKSAQLMQHPTKQCVSPVCSPVSDAASPLPCGNSPSATLAPQQLPDISSHKGSVVAATANSVLKTLFLNLSPYQQDGEQQDSNPFSVPTAVDGRLQSHSKS